MTDINKPDQQQTKFQTATLAGGCFWCLESLFSQISGIPAVISGYTGGNTTKPTYEEVCRGTTGHAEAVQITFNLDIINYKVLLELFFSYHDPTTLNKQGNDIGTHYRSAIYYHSSSQKTDAEQMVKWLTVEKIYDNQIVTEISPFTKFYKAEDYHQGYFTNNPTNMYCQATILPKLEKLKQKHAHLMKH
ncbi:MAG: peptide-methionine (S)-S-oxide reductase [Gammaproteobacteria bacterium]|nr:peptide-methionine (S)-S-oxide reductase [Gammaproteobacteria bacterium]|tara:strand:+ start:1734 stop:2303 length:570 start_codon:yes stop_codon:yes gene_type:complete